MEVLEPGALLVAGLDMGHHLPELRRPLRGPGHHGLHCLRILPGGVALDLLEERALRHGVDRRNDLQLRGALVDVHDAGVAVEALARIVLHEARAAVDLNGVVGQLVGILRREELDQRGEAVGQAVVELHLLALLGFERTFVRDVHVLLVDLHEAGRLVEQRAGALQLGLHVREHLRNGGELDDRLAELGTLLRILQRLAVGSLAQTHRLRADTQTGGVHQRHDVLDQTHLAVAHKLCRSVREDQLARGRALDAELVLDAAHLHAAVALVMNEHRQAAGVGRSLLGTGQDERNLAVAVGNEALHAVEQPGLPLLRPGGLEHHGTQVRTGIGLREVHGAGRAGRHPLEELLLLLLRGELVERLGAVLQAPDVLEAGIGTGHHLVGHDEADEREVQTVVLARESHAAQSGIDHGLHVADRTRGVLHVVVHHARALVVHTLGIRGDHVAAHLAGDLEHAAVRVHCIVEILRRIVVQLLVGKPALLQLHDLPHQRMIQMELQILVI